MTDRVPRLAFLVLACLLPGAVRAAETPLEVGFGEADITPVVGKKPVYLAGFGQNRLATGVNDPLMARAFVLKQGKSKIAVASVDLVGLFHPQVVRIRKHLPEFSYVLVSSTHNHEGPDTLGLWGPGPFKTGIDPAYMAHVEQQTVKAIQAADKAARQAEARIGTAGAPELLHDSREPYVKHDELVALAFQTADEKRPLGVVLQWNCHPETLGSKNTKVSADYVGYTIKRLQAKHRCPIVYLTGTVGGLMTSLRVEVKDTQGKTLPEDSYEKTERFGELLAEVADRALKEAEAVRLTPLEVRSREVFVPLDNKIFQLGRRLGVLDRPAFLWQGDASRAEPAPAGEFTRPLCLKTEIGWLKLGDLEVAAIPGEIYPELVLGKVQTPADPGADFPRSEAEPSIYEQLRGPRRMIIGLANDEIGYIIPKCQWDVEAPFCYGRKKDQYGESNSVGPETAPILCNAFKDLVSGKKEPR